MLSDHERREIERRALEIQAIIERREGQFSAELVPDCEALWHPLAISPGNEFKAVKFLSERGFGVFLPRFTEGASLKLDGVELCGGRRLVFPGHCFVFVWDVMRHWRRIRSCPGVTRILVDGAQRPIIVNDATMDFIQALQYGLDPKPKRKRYNRGKSTENAGDERVDFVLIRTLKGDGPNETLDRVAQNLIAVQMLSPALQLARVAQLGREQRTEPAQRANAVGGMAQLGPALRVGAFAFYSGPALAMLSSIAGERFSWHGVAYRQSLLRLGWAEWRRS